MESRRSYQALRADEGSLTFEEFPDTIKSLGMNTISLIKSIGMLMSQQLGMFKTHEAILAPFRSQL